VASLLKGTPSIVGPAPDVGNVVVGPWPTAAHHHDADCAKMAQARAESALNRHGVAGVRWRHSLLRLVDDGLSAGLSLRRCAALAGVPESTLRRWRADQERVLS
jgi:hypothetical protein